MYAGIGLLLEDELFNKIRVLTLDIGNSINRKDVFNQPPHITIKRPFKIKGLNDLKKVDRLLKYCSDTFSSIELEIIGFKQFGNETIYAYPEDSKKIKSVHEKTLKHAQSLGIIKSEFEGDDYIAHVSVVTGLYENDMTKCSRFLKNESSIGTTVLSKVGLFISTDSKNWIVYKELVLGGKVSG